MKIYKNIREYLNGTHYKIANLVVRLNFDGYAVGEHKLREPTQYEIDQHERGVNRVQWWVNDVSLPNDNGNQVINATVAERKPLENGIILLTPELYALDKQEIAIKEISDNMIFIEHLGNRYKVAKEWAETITNGEYVQSSLYDCELPDNTAILIEYNRDGDNEQDYIKYSDVQSRWNFADILATCRNCELLTPVRDMEQTERGRVCSHCIDNDFTSCEDCGRLYLNSDFVNDVCYRCHEDAHSVNTRDFGNPIVSTTLGEVISNRTFGVEIECELGSITGNTIPKACGIVEDGSIDGDNAYELVTPPLGGQAGEKWLNDLSDVLIENDVRVNRSCGLHVHLIAEDFKGKYVKLRNLVLFYNAIQNIVFSMVPYSRRVNQFCRKIEKVIDLEKVRGVYSIDAFEKAFYGITDRGDIERTKRGKYCDKRYSFLNIHNLFYTGKTIEIRNHSGTIQSGKIIPWVNFHALILDYVSSAKTVEINRMIKKLLKKDLSDGTELLLNAIRISNEHATYLKSRQLKFTPDMDDPFNVERKGASDDEDDCNEYGEDEDENDESIFD